MGRYVTCIAFDHRRACVLVQQEENVYESLTYVEIFFLCKHVELMQCVYYEYERVTWYIKKLLHRCMWTLWEGTWCRSRW